MRTGRPPALFPHVPCVGPAEISPPRFSPVVRIALDRHVVSSLTPQVGGHRPVMSRFRGCRRFGGGFPPPGSPEALYGPNKGLSVRFRVCRSVRRTGTSVSDHGPEGGNCDASDDQADENRRQAGPRSTRPSRCRPSQARLVRDGGRRFRPPLDHRSSVFRTRFVRSCESVLDDFPDERRDRPPLFRGTGAKRFEHIVGETHVELGELGHGVRMRSTGVFDEVDVLL